MRQECGLITEQFELADTKEGTLLETEFVTAEVIEQSQPSFAFFLRVRFLHPSVVSFGSLSRLLERLFYVMSPPLKS